MAPDSSMNEPSAYTPWEKASASRRRFRRWFVDMPTVLYIAGAPHDCTIRDLTPASAGIQLESAAEIAVGTEVALDLGGFGTIQALVRSSGQHHLGLEFVQENEQAVRLAAHLLNLPPERRPHRLKTNQKALLIVDGNAHSCLIEDITRIGACVVMDRSTAVKVGDEVILRQENYDDATASTRWVSGPRVGFMFLQIISAEAEAGALGEAADEVETSTGDFLPGLKRSIESQIGEAVERQTRGGGASERERVVDALIAEEIAKLAHLERRFEQAGDQASGNRVRELAEQWMGELGQKLKRR